MPFKKAKIFFIPLSFVILNSCNDYEKEFEILSTKKEEKITNIKIDFRMVREFKKVSGESEIRVKPKYKGYTFLVKHPESFTSNQINDSLKKHIIELIQANKQYTDMLAVTFFQYNDRTKYFIDNEPYSSRMITKELENRDSYHGYSILRSVQNEDEWILIGSNISGVRTNYIFNANESNGLVALN